MDKVKEKHNFMVRLDTEVYLKMKRASIEEDRSMNNWINRVVKAELERLAKMTSSKTIVSYNKK